MASGMQSWPTMATWRSRFRDAHGLQSAERAGISSPGDENVAVFGMAIQEIRDEFGGSVTHSSAVDANEQLDGQVGKCGLDSLEGAGNATLHDGSGLFDIETEDPVHAAVPASLAKSASEFAGLEADAVVVHSEIGGMGMGNVDGDQGDFGRRDFVGNDGSDLLIDLEFDDQIDLIAHELLGGPDSGGRIIAIVEDEQVDARMNGSVLRLAVTASEKGISPDCFPKPKRTFRGRVISRYWPSWD